MKLCLKSLFILVVSLSLSYARNLGAQVPGDGVQSLCGSVTGGAVNYMAFECWNDAVFQVVNAGSLDSNGWQYTLDGGISDHASPPQTSLFEICGMGFRETADEIWFTLNTGLNLESGYLMPEALNGSVTYGDIFVNLSGLDFATAHTQGRLFGIHFAALNDASVSELGVYGAAAARSVVAQNDGPENRQGYENHIYNILHGLVGYGDLPPNQTYFGLDMGLNVIESGTFLGPISFVTSEELAAAGYSAGMFTCPVTVAFKFPKQLIVDECGVTGGDGSSCRDCAGIACGETVVDECGVCAGDGSSCECFDTFINSEIDSLTEDFAAQCQNAKRLARTYSKTTCARDTAKGKKALASLRHDISSICSSAATTIASISTSTSNCSGDCVATGNQAEIAELEAAAAQLYRLSRKAIGLYGSCSSGGGTCQRSLSECRRSARERERAKRLDEKSCRQTYNETKQSISSIPETTYDCSAG